MTSSDEQLIKNSLLFIHVRENRTIEDKLQRVRSCLEDGADVNATDGNDGGNSPLHVAAKRGEVTVAHFLLSNGADVTRKNATGKTALDIARMLHTNRDIVNLLQNAERSLNDNNLPNTDRLQTPNIGNDQLILSDNAPSEFKYLKRTGTSGVCGQLYETKLLSLVLMRALNDDQIEHFLLGTNIRGIGDMDDICLRYRVKGNDRPGVLFVQAKHREDREKGRLTVEDVQSVSGDFSLRKYFESYLTIKDRFQNDNDDPMFEGDFANVECNLIIYTPAKDHFTKKNTEHLVSDKVHYLLNTGGDTEVFQYDYDEEDIENLTKLTVLERFKKLGTVFLEIIMSEKDKSKMVLGDKLIARYHVVMGREVLQQCKLQQANKDYRLWEFQPEFFESECEYLTVLRKTFIRELSAKRCDQSKITDEDKNTCKLVLQDPCATTISQLIGKLVTYNDKSKKLQFVEISEFRKKFKTDEFRAFLEQFNKIELNENVIHKAIQIKLSSMKIKLPLSFGNLDMSFRGSEVKIQRRIKAIAEKLTNLFEDNKATKIVDINDDVVGSGKKIEQGFIDINGGIGSAVGNLLVLDTNTKMLKFNLYSETMPKNAALFLIEFKDKLTHSKAMPDNADLNTKSLKDKVVHEVLSQYRMKININGFPKDSFNGDEYDKRQARDFLRKLWFYANQAKEDEVEHILKDNITKYYNKDKDENQLKFKIHSDAIFLRSHDEIQKWWMQAGEAVYLNRRSEIFEHAKNAVIDNPLLTVLNFMYSRKIQNMGIEFNHDVLNFVDLYENTRLCNVITDACLLTGIKIMQRYEKKDGHSFIEFDYVLSLPLNDYNTMLQELKHTDIKTLIVIYEKLTNYEGFCNKLKDIIQLFRGNKIVLVTNSILAEEIDEYVGQKYRGFRDDKTYLIDLSEQSQNKVLNESTVVFQGEELPFKSILHENARSLVRTEIFLKLINKERFEIGRSLVDQIYKDVNYFIDRSLTREGDTFIVETLDDIVDNVVVVTGRPGMGKSALLTHLFLNTKLVGPLPWIVRVNLPDYEKEFSRWQEETVTIDIPLVVHFLCMTALKNINKSIKIERNHHSGEIMISHIENIIDSMALFELELFLYLYNSGKVVFLFDDFNAICPHYETEVLQMLKLLMEEGKRMWIMTCPYRHTTTTLMKEFGSPYKLDPLRPKEKQAYLERFFRTNLKLERLNYDQFENVRSFLKYMSKVTNMRVVDDPDREIVPLFSLVFHIIYVMAVKFFKSEINRASAATIRAKVRENFEIDLDQYTTVDEILGRTPSDEELELAGTPLHLYIAANYFKFRIEESFTFPMSAEETRNKWDLMLNSIALYQQYIEAHIRRILYKEDADDDSVVITFRESRKEFFDKHKKLGLFTICREKDLTKFLKPDEIDDIRSTISKIESGEEQSSLINCVVNEVPRFAHLVFAEYFAVEYLTDIMKQAREDDGLNPTRSASLWQSILNIVLFNAPPGVRKAFDYKLKTDHVLADLSKTELYREVVFELLLKQERRSTERDGESHETPLTDAIEDGLINIFNLFLSSAQFELKKGNIKEVSELLKRSKNKFMEFGEEYAEIILSVFDFVKKGEFERLGDLLKTGRLTEVPVRHANNYRSAEGGELQRHIVATTSQLPLLAQNCQQLCQQTDCVKQTLISLAELGVRTALKDILDKLKQPEPDLD